MHYLINLMLLQTSWLLGHMTLDPLIPVIMISYWVHVLDNFSFSCTSKHFTAGFSHTLLPTALTLTAF